MREIKFRGKRIDNEEWVYGCYVREKWSDSSYVVDNHQIKTIKGFSYEVVEKSVGQYTGFKDLNDKEWFENDIAEDGCVVEFINGGWCFKSRFDINDIYPLDTYNAKRKRVVGNTHDKEGSNVKK